ncbi:MAG: hypothetical protein KME10_21000 [Plectolyngbya sp. WJT66-NPBG17]|jgi:hypothetical protein|nr:hypothetical protein [Plectolyngbya sp. WJT66-NPBG17]MBW4526347.1 hypothetical protein [Phormidium tanganyikae FI6-MK23]
MTRSFAALVSLVCLFLGSCGFLVTTSDCYGSIRAGITSILMSAMAWAYLKLVNEKPVGFWLMLYRSGIAIAGTIVLFAVGRIIGAVQITGCQLG